VHAVHLRLPWRTPFPTSQTSPATFTRADGSTVPAPMMHVELEAGYTDDGLAQIVALPLVGGDEAVVVAVPRGSLAAYEAGLTSGSLALAAPSTRSMVNLALPKMTFAPATFSLKGALEAMGMTDAFGTGADFTGMCASTPDGAKLYLEDFVEQTHLVLEEQGVETTATAPIVGTADGGTSGPPQVVLPVSADRPFLVAVVDVPTGAVVMLGDVEDPTQGM
jgi:serine protease inhibitor